MAEERDDADRTEEPSQRRLEQSRERGQVATSREVGHLLLLGSCLLLVILAGPASAGRVTLVLRGLLAAAGQPLGEAAAAPPELLAGLFETGLVLAAWLAALLVAAIAAPFLQNAVVLTGQPLQPKLERISPLAGLRRLFSSSTLAEFLKSLVKLALVGSVAAIVLRAALPELLVLGEQPPGAILGQLVDLSVRLVGTVVALVAAIAAIDWLWQRFHHLQELRMTREEVKEELHESEGDPTVKQRQRQLRLERARRRMMAEVPKATVVVTNPTHYAVALRYEAATMAAPLLIAKGVDQIALKIREVARAHGVPVVENPPLARALHAALEPGAAIPPAHYQAVAELIAYVYRLGRPSPGGPAGTAGGGPGAGPGQVRARKPAISSGTSLPRG